jgi:hypothetical protein
MPNHGSVLIAVCKDSNGFQASMRGHGRVYPFSEVVFQDGLAKFFRDGREVWLSTQSYAEEHFDIIEKPALSDVIGDIKTLESARQEAV